MSKAVLLVAVILCSGFTGLAQNKGLDLTFGNGGIAQTAPYTNKKFKVPTGLIIQPDGKILISGNFIMRYKANGTPDSNFATNGIFIPPISLFSNAIALLPDGKILSLGHPDTGCSYICRLLPNGTVDSSFGKNGISINNRLNPWNMLVQSDGKIIIMGNGCGTIGNPNDPEDSVIVGRFFPNGWVDTAFGRKGFTGAYLGIYGGSISGMAILPDGRIAMGGIGYDDNNYRAMISLRFMPNGDLDTTLGGKGRIFPFHPWYCHGLAVMPDGRMVFALSDLNGESFTRLNADGSPDATFGDAGFTSINGLDVGLTLILADGRLLCGGRMNGDYALARLRPDGKGLDSSFGQNGIITTDITGYWDDDLGPFVLQSDKKIVGLGTGMLDKNTVAGATLVRYNANAATGIQPFANHLPIRLVIYPNPAQKNIRISGVAQDQVSSVEITTTDGRRLEQVNAPKSLTLPVTGYIPGVYLLSVVLKSGEVVSSRLTISE